MIDQVPLRPIREAIEAALGIEDWHLKDFFGDLDERLMPLTRMWDIDDFRKQWAREDRETVPFDFADQVLCILGLQHLWWGELADIYYAVKLEDRNHVRNVPKGMLRCAAEGCSEVFTPKRKDQRFHSGKCLRAQWHRDNRGDRTLMNKRMDKCAHGHDRSPENVRFDRTPNGTLVIRCRECKNDRQRARRAKVAA